MPAGSLPYVRFPLGGMTKHEVRAHARRLGLPNADKPESQEICFVPDGDHAAFRPLARADLEVRVPRVEAVDVHEALGVLRVVRPSFLRILRDADPDVSFRFAIGAQDHFEDSSLHRERGLELEARFDRARHGRTNGRCADKADDA